MESMNRHNEPARHTIAAWIAELQAGEVARRIEAAEALAHLGHHAAEAVPSLARLLLDPNASARKMAALALGRIGSHAIAALPDLVIALEDAHAGVRLRVVVALGELLQHAPHARSWLYQVQGTVSGEAAYLLASVLDNLTARPAA
jgi:HEAT repeat protein